MPKGEVMGPPPHIRNPHPQMLQMGEIIDYPEILPQASVVPPGPPQREDSWQDIAQMARIQNTGQAGSTHCSFSLAKSARGLGNELPNPIRGSKKKKKRISWENPRSHVVQTLAFPINSLCGLSTTGVGKGGRQQQANSRRTFMPSFQRQKVEVSLM